MLAVSLLGHGIARGQTTITATSAQDYATAIIDANGTPAGTVTVIDATPGTVISLGAITLPALSAGTLRIGDGTADTPFADGTIVDNAALSFKPPSATNDTINTIITGSGTVTQSGPGTVTFTDNGANAYSGGTTIAAGATLTLGNGSASGTVGNGPVNNLGALVFNEPSSSSTNFTFGNNITGTGTVALRSPFLSLFILTGSNTYTGGTTINGSNGPFGAVELASPSALPTTGKILLQSVGGLATGYALDAATLNAIDANSVGYVALKADSANALDFTNLPNVSLGAMATNYLNAETWTYSGTFTPTAPGNGSLSQTNYQYQVGGGDGFLSITSNLVNPVNSVAELDAINDGFTILRGTNTFSGGMNVTYGVVELAGSQAYCGGGFGDCPKIQISQSGILATGYALDQATLNAIAGASNGTVALGADSPNNLDFTTLPNVSLGAVGSYTYSGTITPGVNGYLLGGGGDIRIGSGDIFGDPGSYLTVSSDLPGNFGLTVNSTGFDLGTVILVNAKTYSGQTTIDGGTLQLGNGSLNGSIANSAGVTINNDGSNRGELVFNEVAPVIFANPIGGAGDVVQLGPGSVTFTQNETYTGSTTIYAGTLALGSSASIASSSTVGLSDNFGSSGSVLDISHAGSQTVQNLYSFWSFTTGSPLASVNLGPNTLTDVANAGPTAFDGVISGTGAFVKRGPETLTLAGVNTYSGGTTISAGTLVLGGQALFAPAATVGTLGSGPVANNAALVFQEPSGVVFSNMIGGTGTVTQDGPGMVTLSGTNTYSGGTTITSGTLALGDPNATVGTLGSGPVTDNAALLFTEPTALTVGNAISGAGTVTQSGPGTVTFSGTNSYFGGTFIFRTLELGGQAPGAPTATVGTLGSGPVVIESTGLLVFTEPSAVTIANVISGTGSLNQDGPGIVTLSQQEPFTGSTVIYNGTLALAPGASISASSAVTIASTNGSGGFGVLDISKAGNQTVQNLFSQYFGSGTAGASIILGANTLTEIANTGPSTFDGVISGTGGFIKQGAQTLTLAGINTYAGGTTISAGTLALGGQATGAPAATIGTVGSGPVTDNGTLAFTEPSAITVTNVISGTGGLTQVGPGALTLNGASTYTGLTEVQSSTLVVGDSAGSSASVDGSVQVDAGATLAGFGRLGVGQGTLPTLVNSGTVIPGGASGNAVGTLSTSGNYIQGSGGNLLIAVTPAQAAQLQVGGNATLAGTITFAYAPGTYAPKTYTVLAAGGARSGVFDTVVNQGAVPASLHPTVIYVAGPVTDDQVDLVLSNANVVVAPADDSIFSEQLSSLTALADSSAATLLDGGVSANDCATAGVPPTPSEPGAATQASTGMAAVGRMICGAGGWIHVDGTFLGVNGTGGTPNYHANTAGFLAGIDRPVGEGGLRLGIAAGYDHRWLTDSAGASAAADVARFGVYAIQPVGPVVLNVAFLYGHDWDTTNRPTGAGTATAQYGGDEFSGGARVSLPMNLAGFAVVPMAGVRLASVGGNSFTEAGNGALDGFGVSGASATQVSVIPNARVLLAHDFIASAGITVSPYAAVGYQYQAGDSEKPVLLTASDGTTFNAGSARLDRSAATFAAGIAASRGNWSVYLAYGASVAGNWNEQQVSGGLRVNF